MPEAVDLRVALLPAIETLYRPFHRQADARSWTAFVKGCRGMQAYNIL